MCQKQQEVYRRALQFNEAEQTLVGLGCQRPRWMGYDPSDVWKKNLYTFKYVLSVENPTMWERAILGDSL